MGDAPEVAWPLFANCPVGPDHWTNRRGQWFIGFLNGHSLTRGTLKN